MLYTGDFVLRYYVRFSQIRSQLLFICMMTHLQHYLFMASTLALHAL